MYMYMYSTSSLTFRHRSAGPPVSTSHTTAGNLVPAPPSTEKPNVPLGLVAVRCRSNTTFFISIPILTWGVNYSSALLHSLAQPLFATSRVLPQHCSYKTHVHIHVHVHCTLMHHWPLEGYIACKYWEMYNVQCSCTCTCVQHSESLHSGDLLNGYCVHCKYAKTLLGKTRPQGICTCRCTPHTNVHVHVHCMSI